MLTKLLNEADDLLKSKDEELDAQRLKVITELLNEKLNLIKPLGEKIIDACEVDDIEHEIEESEEINPLSAANDTIHQGSDESKG